MDKRDLKAYSRFDGTGRIVPGSTVLRRNKPKVGDWQEVQAYKCCNTTTTTTTCRFILCQLFRNDSDIVQTIEGYACAQNFSADYDVDPGDTVCMQIVLSSSGPFTNLGLC